MGEFVIQTRGLTKYFGRLCAVDQVTLNVPRGAVFALLGRNGSGKSTIIRMMLGLLDPTRGSSFILGEDSRAMSPVTRGKVGYVAEGHPLINWMRVSQIRSFQRDISTKWNDRLFSAVIDHFGLSAAARIATLSRGQRAGVSLALAMATEPELLIMDDPGIGLDPVARRTLLEAMILLTRDAGHTIFFSSHAMEDVERVADHIAILDRSVLRVCAPIESFRGRVRQLVLSFSGAAPSTKMPDIPGLLAARTEGNELRLTLIDRDEASQRAAIEALHPTTTIDAPITLEDAVIGYLGDRAARPTLLQALQETGASS